MGRIVFPEGAGVRAEMRRVPQRGRAKLGALIVQAPVKTRHNVVEVSLAAIVRDSPFQARRQFDPETSADDRWLVESIREVGQKEPVCLRRHGGGEYEVVYGHRRIAALRCLKAETALAIVIEGDPQDLATWTAIENTGLPLSPIEKAELAHLLESALGLSIQQVAARLGCSQRQVFVLKDIHRADDSVRSALGQGAISLAVARSLATAPPGHQPRLAAIAVRNRGRISEAQCIGLVRHLKDSGCDPDEAAAVVGLALPEPPSPQVAVVDGGDGPAGQEERLMNSAGQGAGAEDGDLGDGGGASDRAALGAGAGEPAEGGRRSRPGASGMEGSAAGRRAKAALDAGAVASALQNELTTVDRAAIRSVATRGAQRGLSLRELRIAALLAASLRPGEALDDAEQLKGDPSARIAAEILERFGRLRDLAKRRGASGLAPQMAQALAKEGGALASELKTSKKGD